MEKQQQDLPCSFRRLVAKTTGDTFQQVSEIVERPLDPPSEEQVIVKVHYAGVNGGCETFRARGEWAFARNKDVPEFALGAESSGTVVATGAQVPDLEVGQPVICSGGNAFSEYVTVPARSCFGVRVADAEACTLAVSGLTAAGALWGTAGMKAGDTVLVTAAAGATGHLAVQLAVQEGCRVVAICGGRRKAEAVATLGPARVIDHKAEDVAAVLTAEFGKQIDIAYEGVGGQLRGTVLENLAPGGRLLAVGYIGSYAHNSKPAALKSAPDLPNNDKLMWEGMTIGRKDQQTVYGSVWPKDPSKLQQAKQRLFDMYDNGMLQVWVDHTHDFQGLQSVNDAMSFMLSGQALGKVVVKL